MIDELLDNTTFLVRPSGETGVDAAAVRFAARAAAAEANGRAGGRRARPR